MKYSKQIWMLIVNKLTFKATSKYWSISPKKVRSIDS